MFPTQSGPHYTRRPAPSPTGQPDGKRPLPRQPPTPGLLSRTSSDHAPSNRPPLAPLDTAPPAPPPKLTLSLRRRRRGGGGPQLNSTAVQIRGSYDRPYLSVGLAMQAQASRAAAQAAQAAAGGGDGPAVEVGYREFAHPAYAVSTFEGVIAPIFLIGCEWRPPPPPLPSPIPSPPPHQPTAPHPSTPRQIYPLRPADLPLTLVLRIPVNAPSHSLSECIVSLVHA